MNDLETYAMVLSTGDPYSTFSVKNSSVLPIVIPFLSVWVFVIYVVFVTWHSPVRGHIASDGYQIGLEICSNLLYYLLIGVIIGMFDFAVQLNYRNNPTPESRAAAVITIILNVLINTYGCTLTHIGDYEYFSYCKPTLSWTAGLFSMLTLAFLSSCVVLIASLLLYRNHWKRKKQSNFVSQSFVHHSQSQINYNDNSHSYLSNS